MRRWARSWALRICAASALVACSQAAQAGSRFATSSTARIEESVHLDFTIRIPALIYLGSRNGATQTLLLTPAARKSAEESPNEGFSASTNAGTLAFAPADRAPARDNGQYTLNESLVSPNIRAYVVAAP